MSTIKNNPLLKGASGMLGNVVVYRERNGQVIMSNRPKRPTLTPKLLAVRERFLEAVKYGKAVMANPDLKAEYQAGVGEKFVSAYSIAVADFLKAPEIKSIDLLNYNGAIGDLVEINATDDFKVVSVYVTIHGSDGSLLEEGDAIFRESSASIWVYTAKVQNAALPGSKISVRVKDKPGNLVTQEQLLQ